MEEKIAVKMSLHGHLYTPDGELEEVKFCGKRWLVPSMMIMIGQVELSGKISAYEVLKVEDDASIAKVKMTELPAKIESKQGYAVDTVKIFVQTPCGELMKFGAKYAKHPWHVL